MSRDPSLLPEDMRSTEDDLPASRNEKNGGSAAGFHMPESSDGTQGKRPPVRRRNGEPSTSPPEVATSSASASVAPAAPPLASRVGRPAAGSVRPIVVHAPSTPDAESGDREFPRLHMPDILRNVFRRKEISLIPEELRKGPVSPRWPQAVAAVGLVLILPLVGIPWFVLRGHVADARARTVDIETKRAGLISKIADAERDVEPHRGTAERATVVRALLDQHGNWAPVFALVESRTLPGMRYEQFSADATGSVTLSTVAPGLRTAAAQLVALYADERARDVSTSGFTSAIDERGVIRGTRFDLRLRVDPTLFTTIGSYERRPDERAPATTGTLPTPASASASEGR